MLRSNLTLRIVIGFCVGGSIVGGTALAGSRVIPVAGGGELQAQVKATATKVIPAVVSIASTMMVRDQAFSDEALPFGLFKDAPARRQYGQGSGVIVSSDGYILTNNHVIADAVDVDVILADRRQYKGRVVATDPRTDVAVVKIQAANLPTVTWGDSSTLAVGEFVLAIGNPLGLSRSVTFGIVSAVGRADVGVADFEDFIQTDAPINPGNSGGALVTINGELVGINTAIASPTGGSVGVGFAIPSNMARAAMQSLLKTGRVVRGFLGASTQDMDSGHLRNLVAASTIGSKHRLDLMRESKPYQAELVVQEAPRDRNKKNQGASASAATAHPLAGVVFDDVTAPLARQMDLVVTSGVVVTDIEEGSLAESSGLQPGDVVMELNRQPIPNFDVFQRLADPIKPSDLALLLVNRQGNVMYIPVQSE